jgi:hypothetical protein
MLRLIKRKGDRVWESDFPVRSLVLAGFTGRDTTLRERHVAELVAMGISRPPQMPMFYRVTANLVTTANTIQVVGGNSSGEVEVVLLVAEDGMWVGVGSDHTDRRLEREDVVMAKQVCEKPLAPEVWCLEDVADLWDNLVIRSFVLADSEHRLYQEGKLAEVMDLSQLLKSYLRWGGDLEIGTVLFCGTIPIQGGCN